LAKFLLSKGYTVYGLARRHVNQNFENLNYLNILHDVEIVDGDLTDESSLNRLIKNISFDEIYNLAAQSWIDYSWKLNKTTTEVNAIGVLNILNAIKEFSPNTKFFQASSSEIFDASTPNLLNEQDMFKPKNPYAISKLYAHWTTVNFREHYKIHASNGIFFNHDSPIRGKEFISRKITHGVASIHAGKTDTIKLGNLDVFRDWGFAGDYVQAAWMMLQQEIPDDYVIASGTTHSINDILDIAFLSVGIDNWTKYVIQDTKFVRPREPFKRCGDSTKAKSKLNWTPCTDFGSMITNMVKEDINRL
jgi:GDPmannose 4,6-dehydratase